jgi:DNA-binding MarR family transcriptional regulator
MPNHPSEANDLSEPNESPAAALDRVLASYERFHAWLTKAHVPDFLELNLTLAQLRALYLVAAAGPMRMSDLADRLGTAPSTTTGVIDGLVRLGLVERVEDPTDRRRVHVAATAAARDRLEDFSELGRGRLRVLLGAIRSADDLVTIERAIDLLAEAGRALPEEPR